MSRRVAFILFVLAIAYAVCAEWAMMGMRQKLSTAEGKIAGNIQQILSMTYEIRELEQQLSKCRESDAAQRIKALSVQSHELTNYRQTQ